MSKSQACANASKSWRNVWSTPTRAAPWPKKSNGSAISSNERSDNKKAAAAAFSLHAESSRSTRHRVGVNAHHCHIRPATRTMISAGLQVGEANLIHFAEIDGFEQIAFRHA